MRKKVLGTLAALALSAGGALAQFTNPPIPPALPPGAVPPGIGEMPNPGGDPNALFPNGAPMYPNGGPYGQAPFESPAMSRGGIGGGAGGGAAGNPSLWFDGSYLLMFPKSQPVGYPLLTTSSPADAGVVGLPTTSILAGGKDLGLGNASGFRLSAGLFRPSSNGRFGGEFVATYLSPVSNNVYASSGSSSNGIPVIARPFVNTGTGPSSLVASFPTFTYGSALSRATTKFYGLEANSLLNLYRTAEGDSRHWVVNVIAGFRFAQLSESLDVSASGTLLPGSTAFYNGTAISSPTTVEVKDSFATKNMFYGGQAGFQSQFGSGRWYLGLTGKVGAGVIHQEIDVNGSTSALNPVARTVSSSVGGLFANASNIGSYRNDVFGVMTDLNASFGYQITPWLIANIGYNFIHMSSVARPGNLFNGRVDGSIIPASATYGAASTGSPSFNAKQDDFWVHGLNFGVIVRY